MTIVIPFVLIFIINAIVPITITIIPILKTIMMHVAQVLLTVSSSDPGAASNHFQLQRAKMDPKLPSCENIFIVCLFVCLLAQESLCRMILLDSSRITVNPKLPSHLRCENVIIALRILTDTKQAMFNTQSNSNRLEISRLVGSIKLKKHATDLHKVNFYRDNNLKLNLQPLIPDSALACSLAHIHQSNVIKIRP